MSNTNDVVVYYKKETAFGTLATGNYDTLRVASDTLKTEMGTTPSDELGSRRVKDVARTDLKVGGALTGRWSYAAHDDLLLSALMADEADTWATPVTSALSATNTLEATASGNTLTVAGAAKLDWSTIANGRWIRVKGFTTNGTEFRCRKVSHSSDIATVDGITLVDEGPINSGEVEMGAYITDGNTARSWSIEREYSDLASNFRVFTGCNVTNLTLSARAGGLTDIVATILGKSETFGTSTSAGTPVAAPSNRLINGVDHVRAVLVDGTSFPMSEWALTIEDNARERNIFGELGPESIGFGQFNASVSMNAYYANNTNLAKYLAFTDTGLALDVLDSAGNSYIVHLPLGNFTDGSASAGGSNQDVFQPLVFTSKEYTLGSLVMQMQIAKWDV